MLFDRWQVASAGEGQVALVTSEAGVGKSRIIRALRERLGKIGTITSTRTTIVLETVKETAELPIAIEEEREAVSA